MTNTIDNGESGGDRPFLGVIEGGREYMAPLEPESRLGAFFDDPDGAVEHAQRTRTAGQLADLLGDSDLSELDEAHQEFVVAVRKLRQAVASEAAERLLALDALMPSGDNEIDEIIANTSVKQAKAAARGRSSRRA